MNLIAGPFEFVLSLLSKEKDVNKLLFLKIEHTE